jgi:hypothetical protein
MGSMAVAHRRHNGSFVDEEHFIDRMFVERDSVARRDALAKDC